MPFLSISPVYFRNISNGTMDMLAKEVYFTGENGQGKSNLLEALYYLAYGSSFRTHNEAELIKNGENAMSVRSIFREESGITHTTCISLENGKKKIEKDGKIIHDRKDLINTMPCVLYNHDDLDFVIGSPERRRFLIDQSLSMYDVVYIDILRRYKRILKNRNISLKEKKYDIAFSYNIQLAMNGLEIQKKRKNAIFQFNQIFGKLYQDIAGIDGLSIRYIPSWLVKSTESNAYEMEKIYSLEDTNLPSLDMVMDILQKKAEVEKALGTSVTGPHRDKIVFMRNKKVFVPQASTGQRRMIALILRTAQALYYTQVTQKKPILLMDDVLLELDPEKRKRVTVLLPEYEQLFCTFLPGEPYEQYKHDTTRVYRIENGTWKDIS